MNRGRDRRNDPLFEHLAGRNGSPLSGEDADADLWDQYDFVDVPSDLDWVQIHHGDCAEMEVREPGPILRPEPVPERDLELEATYGPHNDAEYWLRSRFPYNEWEYDDNGEVVTRRPARNHYMFCVLATQYVPYEEMVWRNQLTAKEGRKTDKDKEAVNKADKKGDKKTEKKQEYIEVFHEEILNLENETDEQRRLEDMLLEIEFKEMQLESQWDDYKRDGDAGPGPGYQADTQVLLWSDWHPFDRPDPLWIQYHKHYCSTESDDSDTDDDPNLTGDDSTNTVTACQPSSATESATLQQNRIFGEEPRDDLGVEHEDKQQSDGSEWDQYVPCEADPRATPLVDWSPLDPALYQYYYYVYDDGLSGWWWGQYDGVSVYWDPYNQGGYALVPVDAAAEWHLYQVGNWDPQQQQDDGGDAADQYDQVAEFSPSSALEVAESDFDPLEGMSRPMRELFNVHSDDDAVIEPNADLSDPNAVVAAVFPAPTNPRSVIAEVFAEPYNRPSAYPDQYADLFEEFAFSQHEHGFVTKHDRPVTELCLLHTSEHNAVVGSDVHRQRDGLSDARRTLQNLVSEEHIEDEDEEEQQNDDYSDHGSIKRIEWPSYYSLWKRAPHELPDLIRSGEFWTIDWRNRPLTRARTVTAPYRDRVDSDTESDEAFPTQKSTDEDFDDCDI